MRAAFVFTPFLGLLLPFCVGCGGDAVVHDDAQKLYIEAMKVRANDQAQALDLLTQSIEVKPLADAYYHRAWIYALQQKDDQAQPDIAAGLELNPDSQELQWLDGELKKPAAKRQLTMPPAVTK